MQNNPFQYGQSLTYIRKQASADMFRYIKAVGFPIGCFFLSMFAINTFGLFGADLIAPFTAAMWVCGVIVGLVLPSHRSGILRETHITIAVYQISLMVVRAIVPMVSGVSSEMLMATYNQAIPVASGQAFSGYMQTLLWITTIMTPVGFIFMEIKKVFTLRRQDTVKRTHNRMLGTLPNNNHFDE